MCSATVSADAAASTPNTASLSRPSYVGLWVGLVGCSGLFIGAGLL